MPARLAALNIAAGPSGLSVYPAVIEFESPARAGGNAYPSMHLVIGVEKGFMGDAVRAGGRRL